MIISFSCSGNSVPQDSQSTDLPLEIQDSSTSIEDSTKTDPKEVETLDVRTLEVSPSDLPADTSSNEPDPDASSLDTTSPPVDISPPPPPQSFVPNGYVLEWEDTFDSLEINTDNWVVASLRDPITGDLVPGAKGDHLLNYGYAGYITEEDTYVEDGNLVLRNQKRNYEGKSPAGDFEYTSGWVMSMHRVFFNKGYMEIRAQFPSGDKVWPAMWLISEELVWCPEWDMWEYFGFRNELENQYDNMGTHLCYDGWPNQKWKSNWLKNFDAEHDCEAWHTYGFEWTEDEARWYLDGVLVHSISATSLGANQHLWPNEDMYIVLNNGQRTDSPDETTTWPNYLKVDFVRLFQKE